MLSSFSAKSAARSARRSASCCAGEPRLHSTPCTQPRCTCSSAGETRNGGTLRFPPQAVFRRQAVVAGHRWWDGHTNRWPVPDQRAALRALSAARQTATSRSAAATSRRRSVSPVPPGVLRPVGRAHVEPGQQRPGPEVSALGNALLVHIGPAATSQVLDEHGLAYAAHGEARVAAGAGLRLDPGPDGLSQDR